MKCCAYGWYILLYIAEYEYEYEYIECDGEWVGMGCICGGSATASSTSTSTSSTSTTAGLTYYYSASYVAGSGGVIIGIMKFFNLKFTHIPADVMMWCDVILPLFTHSPEEAQEPTIDSFRRPIQIKSNQING